ncbi:MULTISPECIES: GGDEF domain-containing protein [unclassified Mesotoga]|nr:MULTISPECIES: GGDEF domain-containing protein [unclassified Mesotoga]MDI9366893.1 diguanylate cyclase [Thermotogota bacterium]MDD3680468.1 diguanylate cyclase [Mesotoga sp.]MDD4207185.1 diguanylate cyclase [Mesotoga sp.]MDD5682475.1 diguanylate cyclase [Mesotoga sp.]RLL81472.1 diguanylate cyclase [Mesotoga sp. BH458_6_3_2_1]
MEENKNKVVELLKQYMSTPEDEPSRGLSYLKEAVFILNGQGKTLAAHEILEKELRKFEDNSTVEMAILLNMMIKLSTLVGDFASAIEHSKRAQVICTEKNERELLTKVIINTSGLYFKMKDYDKALMCANKALQMAKKNGDEINAACCLNNIAIIHENGETGESGIPYLEEAVKIKEKHSMNTELPSSYMNLAELYYDSERKAEAAELLEKARKIAKATENEYAIAETMKYEARFLKGEGDLASAMNLLEQVREYHQENGNKTELLGVLNDISSVYELMGDSKDALNIFKQITELSRSIFKEEQARSIAQLESSFEAREKLKEINYLAEQNKRLRTVNEEISEKNNELQEMKAKLEEINKLLEKQAETDPLTGLLNHRKMKSVLDSEISRAERYETPLTMIMIDLDNFKSINDSYGHLKGDELLAAIGKLIRSSIRKNDFAFRYGGEEFLILLPSADMRRTTDVYSRLKESLREHLEIPVSFSAGARQWKGESSDEFISIVDKLLYEAKARGKDRLQISEAAI